MNIDYNPLNMMSKSFHFIDNSPVHPLHSDIGVRKVVAVIVHQDGHYELGLSDTDDSDDFDYYPISRLNFSATQIS